MSSIGAALGMAPDTRKWKESPRIADNDTFVGVEVELENLGNFGPAWTSEMRSNGLWNITKDGSLRNSGLEFIMSTGDGQPLKGGDITRAMFRFKKVWRMFVEAGNPPPECSSRTSVHIHIDVRDLEVSQLKKLFLLYAVFEETFFKWSDLSRYDSNYCRSLEHNQDITNRLSTILKISDDMPDLLHAHLSTGNKYDAMNYLSIKQRGSVEFRLMRGTYDTGLILQWINLLLCLKLAAKDKSIIIHSFPDDMSRRGLNTLIDQVFGKWGTFLKEYASELDILRGVRKAQDILLANEIDNLNTQFESHSPKECSHLEAFKKAIKGA
ncbi:MAG: amidoligase family protein [Chromatiaceae bacterium]|nr:amidoligase family protein [Chromatiaceae bacterium]